MKVYCTNKECTLANKCLRVQAISNDENGTLYFLNPKFTKGGDDCEYFLTCEPTRMGKGFKNMLNRLTKMQEAQFRSKMMGKYPRNKYFKLRKGEVLCSPTDCANIKCILEEMNLPTDNVFDDWASAVIW